MGIISDILKTTEGKASLSIKTKDKEILEVSIKGKEITVDVKDPFAVLDLGVESFLKKKGESGTMKKLKDSGFKIKLKYKMFKVEL